MAGAGNVGRIVLETGIQRKGKLSFFLSEAGRVLLLSILAPKESGWMEDDRRAGRRLPGLRGRSIAAGVFPYLRAALDAVNSSDDAVSCAGSRKLLEGFNQACDVLESAKSCSMAEDKKHLELMELDPVMLQAGETVSRLAIELAKMDADDEQRPDVDAAVPKAWRLLRLAWLEIATHRREPTIEDYKKFWIRPPRELLEALRPPPPPPYREKFVTLFSKDEKDIFLPSKPIEGLNEKFEWSQLVPWDAASQPPSHERKTTPHKIAWAVVDSRVREYADKLIHDADLVNLLCSGFNWRWDWHDVPFRPAKTSDQITGVFKPWLNRKEWECLAKCAHEISRPHNRSLELVPRHKGNFIWEPVLTHTGDDSGLPGPPPANGVGIEALYAQLKAWAEAVLEAWKKEQVQSAFDAFWAEGKEKGFLWEDVKAMALHTKRHKGGIKWLSGAKSEKAPGSSGGNGSTGKQRLGRM